MPEYERYDSQGRLLNTMIAASPGTVAIWQIAGLRKDTLPILPGIVVAALVYVAIRIFGSADGSASVT